MEIKINKEVRKHQESIFFGLSFRQLACCVLAVGATVGIYLGLHNILGDQITSWLCILAAAPLGVAGFFRYNGMYFEQFAWAVIETLLRSRPRGFEAENYFYECCKGEDKHD